MVLEAAHFVVAREQRGWKEKWWSLYPQISFRGKSQLPNFFPLAPSSCKFPISQQHHRLMTKSFSQGSLRETLGEG